MSVFAWTLRGKSKATLCNTIKGSDSMKKHATSTDIQLYICPETAPSGVYSSLYPVQLSLWGCLPAGCMESSTQPRLSAPEQHVRSSALYMALFSKHCSSHYHHHMLRALSSLISASAHSHLGGDSERELRGGERERGRRCHECA